MELEAAGASSLRRRRRALCSEEAHVYNVLTVCKVVHVRNAMNPKSLGQGYDFARTIDDAKLPLGFDLDIFSGQLDCAKYVVVVLWYRNWVNRCFFGRELRKGPSLEGHAE